MLPLRMPAAAPPIPRKLDLRKDSRLRIEWADGSESTFPLAFLRQMCPCAACRTARTGTDPHQLLQPQASEVMGERGDSTARRKSLNLRVVPRELTSAADPVHVTDAQLVGNYAIQLTVSDGHTSGIYSFVYLRELVR